MKEADINLKNEDKCTDSTTSEDVADLRELLDKISNAKNLPIEWGEHTYTPDIQLKRIFDCIN